MVNDEAGARFMDSYIWASVYEEVRRRPDAGPRARAPADATPPLQLQAMRDIVETEDPEDSSILGSEDLTPDNNTDLLFPGKLSAVSLDDLQPDPVHGFKLWQLFLDRVKPLTKVIHAPTVQPLVMDAAAGMSGVPLHSQALLFSMYNMSVISLSDAECVQMLGISRDAALQRFTTGTKTALSRFNFPKNYNMSVLQALVLYLVRHSSPRRVSSNPSPPSSPLCPPPPPPFGPPALTAAQYSLQGRYDRHAAWILSGTVVRIAQKMGYHRDGEQLSLDPFETEMRRRIWWQIVIQDSKYAMLSGLRQTMLPLRWDTKMPQNVNDADIVPGSTEPVEPRRGPTEMAFSLLFNEIYRFKMASDNSNDAPVFEAAMLGQDVDGGGGGSGDSATSQETTLTRFRTQALGLESKLMELEAQYVDVNAGKVHRAALTIRPMITNKLGEMLVPVREQPEWGTEIFGPKDNLFKMVIMGNEQRMDAFEQLQQTGFLWFVKLHFQLDMFAVMTGQLCQRPMGSLADRAWAVTERVYNNHGELYNMSQKQYSMQAQFTLKAWRTRERAFAHAGQAPETPRFVLRLCEAPPPHDGRSSAQTATPQQQQANGDMDPFLGGYLDVASLNWDVFGDVGNGGDELSAAMFGGLGLGDMAGMGPTRAAGNAGNQGAF